MATSKKAVISPDGQIKGQLTAEQQQLTQSPLFQLSLGLFKVASAKEQQTAKSRQEALQKLLDDANAIAAPSMS